MKKPLLLEALAFRNESRAPIWLMRQAGRYIPDYQRLRQKHSLWQLFHEPQLAAEVTCMPLKLLPLDAAILFSDITLIAEVFGWDVHFSDQKGPLIQASLDEIIKGNKLSQKPVYETLGYIFEAIRLAKPQLDVPLLGFSGAPFTVATYLLDSGHRGDPKNTKILMEQHPQEFKLLLSQIASVTAEYLLLQIKAGVDAVQIFDSWADVMSDKEREEFCYPYLKQIIDAVSPSGIPVIIFTRGSSRFAQDLALLSPTALSVDDGRSLYDLRQSFPHLVLQGNLSPQCLLLSQAELKEKAITILQSMEGDSGFIFNLGHGVLPQTPFSNVQMLAELVTTWPAAAKSRG